MAPREREGAAYEVREEERFGRFEEAWRGEEGLPFVPWGDLGEVCEVGFLELTGPVECECECECVRGGEGEGEGGGGRDRSARLARCLS